MVVALKESGIVADPQPALVRAARLRSVARLVRGLSGNDAILNSYGDYANGPPDR